MLPDPGLQVLKVTAILFQQANKEKMGFLCIHLKPVTVEPEKHVCCKECNALVSIDKGVVHDQRLEQRSGHLNEIGVVTGLRSIKRTFQ